MSYAEIFGLIFLSPLVFICLFLVSSFFVPRFKWFFVLSSVCFYLLSVSITTEVLLGSLEEPFLKPKRIDFKPDAVVVLGGGINASAPDSKLTASAYKRVVQAVLIAKKMEIPLLVSGGGRPDVNNGLTESFAAIESINTVADSLGIARPLTSTFNGGFGVLLEEKSVNTLENGANSASIMRSHNILNPKIVLVSSAFHMKRAKAIFEKNSFTVAPYAVDFRLTKDAPTYKDFIPSFFALESNFLAIKEHIAMAKFILLDGSKITKAQS